MSGYQCTFFLIGTEYWIKQLKEGGPYFGSQILGDVHSIRESQRQKPEAAGLVASAVRKHGETNTGTQPIFSFLFSPDPQFIGWYYTGLR